ncbi:MAG: PEGA domain-containing protein, partial [Planctomycetes bacterium]|nr:PEGA domain-containing protein [Planctomycetota bacterium]
PKPEDGYLLTCTGSGTQVEAALLRKGAEVGRGKCALAAPASRVRLARRGNCLIAYADDEPLLGWVDPSPLSGTAVAYAGDIPPEKVQVLSDDVWVYTFEDAPADWRVESGRWEVTNRWQCDPRWSFFSGRPDGKAKLAALWNKREFSGDVCLEFAAAIQMDRARGGRYYEYARDINATLCADGYDLTSGYSFIFGGWQNRHTRILRGKEVVAETTGRLIPRDIHNTWFYIKVEKRGPHLSFWIDNEPVLKYTDARPLAGRRLALWTYDVGVMLARVRVSSPEHKDREWPVAANPSAQKSCYDETVVAKPVPTPPASPVAAQTAALIQKLADPSDEVRWNAAMELAALGEAAVPALVEALSTASDEPRWKAEAALRKIGSPAVPHLVAALKDARVVVRRSAAYLLGEMAGDAAITALGETLCDADDDVRWKAAVALTHLGQACVPVALKQLASDNAEARKCAAWMLQEVQSVEAVGPLVAALSDPDRDVAWKAAIALKKLGPSVVPQLAPALSSERPRRYVVWLLKELPGAEAATALAKLVSTTPPAKAQPTSVPAPAQPLLPATLQVTSTPEKATVFLYDRYIGLTPVTVPQVAVGPHALKLVKRGYEAWAEPVLVLPDATEVRATLKAKASAQLSVTSTPDRADVYVDDKLAGATPLLLTGLPADTYRVRIQKDNYAPWKSEVAAAADQVTRVHGQLTLKAEAYYLAAIKKEPNVAAHYSELAHLYALENKFDKMRDALAKAVELIATGQSDGDGRVRQEIAKIYMASFVYGDERALASARAEIEKLLENEIRQRPKVLETHLLLGRLYENAGRAAEAIQAATRAVQLFPERYEPEWMLGRAYMVKYQAGDAAAARLARSHLEAAIRLCQTPRERAEIEKHLRQLPA